MKSLNRVIKLRPGLAQKITIPFVSLLLSMLLIETVVFGYWTTTAMEERTWEGLVDLSASLTRDLKAEEDRLLVAADIAANSDSVRVAVGQADATALRQVLLPAKASNGLDLVKVVDGRGRPIIELRSNLLADDRIDDKKAVLQAISGMFLADVVEVEGLPKVILAGIAPIKSTQGIIGGIVVGHVIDRDSLSNLFPLGRKHNIMVIGKGKTYASNIDGAVEGLFEEVAGEGGRIRLTIGGQPRIGTTLPITIHEEETGLSVVVVRDVDDLEDQQRRLWLRLAAYFLVGAGLIMLVGLAVARGITSPIVALSKVAERFSQGDMTARARIDSADEVGALGQAFNVMVGALDESYQKVSNAYAELDGNHQDLIRTHRQLRSLLEVSTSLTTTLHFQPLLDTIGRALLELGRAEAVWLLTVDHELRLISGHDLFVQAEPDGRRLLAALGATDGREQLPLDGLGEAVSQSLVAKTPAFFSDISQMTPEQRVQIFGRQLEGQEIIDNLAVIPLVAEGEVLAIAVLTTVDQVIFSPEERSSISTFANTAALAVRNARLFAEVERLGVTDALTQVGNHRAIHDFLGEEISRAERYGHPVSVMIIDVDDLKLFNDTFGHLIGDQVLQRVSQILGHSCRSTDRIGRCGGDEFMIVAPETDAAGAELLAQRILLDLAQEKIVVGENQSVPISCSIGIASYPADATSQQALVEKADAAMYQTKRSGGSGSGTASANTASHFAIYSSWNVLDGLVAAVDNKDRYTREHSETVAKYAMRLAAELGIGGAVVEHLRVAALIHDVGKLGVPDKILRKPGPLTLDERRIVEQHPSFGILLINPIPFPEVVLDAVKYHHERYDGQGYPEGLKGEEIPRAARMLAVVDAFSAMVVDRPYRKAMPVAEAIRQLRDHSGTQFDPLIVEAFLQVLALEGILVGQTG